MNGHWVSQTRKLNKHYQSAGRAVVPLWSNVMIPGCGGCISAAGEYGLILENDGIYICNQSGWTKEIYLSGRSIASLQGNIMPLFYILYESIYINGSPFPNLRNVRLSDSTGKVKFKYGSFTFSSNGQTETANAILIYVNKSDLIMSQQTPNYAVSQTFPNVKFHYILNAPKSNPLVIGVRRNGLRLSDGINTANIAYSKEYTIDSAGRMCYTPPAIGNGIVLSNSVQGSSFDAIDYLFGGCGLLNIGFNQFDNLYAKNGIVSWIDDYDSVNITGVYDNFDIPSVSFCATTPVTITDNDGLYYDGLRSGSDLQFDILPDPQNSSQIVRWI